MSPDATVYTVDKLDNALTPMQKAYKLTQHEVAAIGTSIPALSRLLQQLLQPNNPMMGPTAPGFNCMYDDILILLLKGYVLGLVTVAVTSRSKRSWIDIGYLDQNWCSIVELPPWRSRCSEPMPVQIVWSGVSIQDVQVLAKIVYPKNEFQN
jgi:hypothetical protein